MVPAGKLTEDTIQTLLACSRAGDMIIDGGNSYFRDSLRGTQRRGEQGIEFVDAGVAGGIWGLENGYCLMVGGDAGAGRAGSSRSSRRLLPKTATRTSAPPGAGITRRWCTTGSSTA